MIIMIDMNKVIVNNKMLYNLQIFNNFSTNTSLKYFTR